jgi:hypothetical protein
VLFVPAIVWSARAALWHFGPVAEGSFKIMLSHLQVVSFVRFFAPQQWSDGMKGFFMFQASLSTGGFVNIDCLSTPTSGAEMLYGHQIFSLLLPLIVGVIMYVFWYVHTSLSEKTILKPSAKATMSKKNDLLPTRNDKWVSSMVGILYVLYPMLCYQATKMLDCTGAAGDAVTPLWLTVDLDEPCFQGRHLHMMIGICVPQILLFVIGLPAGLFVTLLRAVKTKPPTNTDMWRWGLFIREYSVDRWFWELVPTVRKLTFATLAVLGGSLGEQKQSQVALLVLLVSIMLEVIFRPRSAKSKTGEGLMQLEVSGLLVIWLTTWCGLMMRQEPGHQTDQQAISEETETSQAFWTTVAVSANIVLMVWMLLALFGENSPLVRRFTPRCCLIGTSGAPDFNHARPDNAQTRNTRQGSSVENPMNILTTTVEMARPPPAQSPPSANTLRAGAWKTSSESIK